MNGRQFSTSSLQLGSLGLQLLLSLFPHFLLHLELFLNKAAILNSLLPDPQRPAAILKCPSHCYSSEKEKRKHY